MKISVIIICVVAFCIGSSFALKCYSCSGDETCKVIECTTLVSKNYCFNLDKTFLGVRLNSKGCTPSKAICAGLSKEECQTCDTDKCNGSGKIVANIIFMLMAVIISKFLL
ncbi:hypothetical protein ACFFRR_000246 [Megaselia abdita]